jgi:hypothetical protein
MRTARFRAETLTARFRERRIVTMDEMKRALSTSVDMTVFRKLREVGYLTSYTHEGQYYTLEALAEFDQRGLFGYRGVRFSRFGSLVDTAERFV